MITANPSTRRVYVGGVPVDLDRSLKYRNHSPDGFAWGYGGSGPAQLALALLLHFTDSHWALEHYQDFEFEVVASWPPDSKINIHNRVVTDWIRKNGGELL